MPSYENLGHLRERFGYSPHGVTRLTGIEKNRLEELERGAAPSIVESEQLARIFGIDADVLSDVPIRVSQSALIHALASHEEFKSLSDTARARTVACAVAARDLASLRRVMGEPVAVQRLAEQRPRLVRRAARIPAIVGGLLAADLRKAWRLGNGPIRSLRDLLRLRLPSVTLLYADLTPSGPAGLTFVDAAHGPAVVLNTVGKNENPLVRRFSLAHELCHVLVDGSPRAPLAQLSGYLTESGLDREQRANGFAIRLLCPEVVLQRLQRGRTPSAQTMARELARYGVHYSALRLYLRKVAHRDVPATPPAEAVFDPSGWADAERSAGLADFPLEAVPSERRTEVARLASHAYASGILRRGQFAEFLGVSRAEPLDRVLHHFGLDPPVSHAA